jgi:hypothetical protein
MGDRGRKPATELQIVDNSSVLAIPRAEPPEELSADEAIEWRAYTNRMPADYFGREHYPLLVQLCRHIVSCRHLDHLIGECADAGQYIKLLSSRANETRTINMLLRSMRMTHQANIRQELSATPIVERKPWE